MDSIGYRSPRMQGFPWHRSGLWVMRWRRSVGMGRGVCKEQSVLLYQLWSDRSFMYNGMKSKSGWNDACKRFLPCCCSGSFIEGGRDGES